MMRLTLVALPFLAFAFSACGGSTPPAPQAQAAAAAGAPASAPTKPAPAAAKAHADDGDEAGCLHGDAHEDGSCEGGAKAPAADAQGHFGAAFELAQAQPLSQALAGDAAPDGAVRVRGTVEAVCQKKGCWMEITDGPAHARILVADHAFALPSGARGKLADVEGTVEVRELSEAQVKHIEKDAGRDPSKVGGTRKEYVITARAVELAAKS